MTSTYFEGLAESNTLAARGYSRDARLQASVASLWWSPARACHWATKSLPATAPTSPSSKRSLRPWSSVTDWPTAYVLRTKITDWDAEMLWRTNIQLSEAEAAFRIHKSELSIRPIWASAHRPGASPNPGVLPRLRVVEDAGAMAKAAPDWATVPGPFWMNSAVSKAPWELDNFFKVIKRTLARDLKKPAMFGPPPKRAPSRE